ncbi:MAG TPA: c-type cytochrome [Gemmatimonadales bacterium]|nr:c-type cytochrome [Gemmatimonadales bacterium]
MLKLAPALIAGLAAMGGWAVVTVKDLPEYLVAGQQYTLEFQVRQHGKHLLTDLRPRLEMRSSQRDFGTVAALQRGATGTYAVTFTPPTVDRLELTINSGFGDTRLRLYPIAVLASGASRPAMALAERGQALFVAKGCNTCHTNSDLRNRPENRELTVGPALGGRQLATHLVIQKMQQPASQIMPELGLTDSEVAAIAAFVSGGQAAGGGR